MQSKRASDWSGWLLAFAFLGATGAAIKLGPSSSRLVGLPGGAGEQAEVPIDPRGQISYAWQDPFSALPPERDFSKKEVREAPARTSELALREIVQRATANGVAPASGVEPVSEVWVMLAESGPEPERVEDRRRHRVALHEALALHKVLPLQRERVLPVYHDWDRNTSFLPSSGGGEDTKAKSSDELPLVLEAFRGNFQGRPILITVAWVDELEVQGRTFRFADSLAETLKRAIRKTPGAQPILLGDDPARNLRSVILGPSSSGKLRQLVAEPPTMRLNSPMQLIEAYDRARGIEVDFQSAGWRNDAQERLREARGKLEFEWNRARLPQVRVATPWAPQADFVRSRVPELWRLLLLHEALSGRLTAASVLASNQEDALAPDGILLTAAPRKRNAELEAALWRLAESLGRAHALRTFRAGDLDTPGDEQEELTLQAARDWIQAERQKAERALAMSVSSVEKRFRPLSRVDGAEDPRGDNTPLDELTNLVVREILIHPRSYRHEHHVYSPRATALRTSFFPFGSVANLADRDQASLQPEHRQYAHAAFLELRKQWFQGRGLPNNALHHYALEDRTVVGNLIQELNNRGVQSADEVLLIVEWGSFYATSFEKQFREAIEQEEEGTRADTGERKRPLTSFYFGGIDGVGADVDMKPPDAAMRAFPAGRTQGDYLTRLARVLDQAEQKGRKIKAVGVVGRDVYDKLMVLQAIRPVLSNAIMFTTDADARLGDPSQAAWTRNLLIASSHGLRVTKEVLALAHEHEDSEHGHDHTDHGELDHLEPAPFRDSYQTSTFLASCAALQTAIPSDEAAKAQMEATWIATSEKDAALLFEVGHQGLFALNQRATLPTSKARRAILFLASLLAIALLIAGAFPPLRRLMQGKEDGRLILHTANVRLIGSACVLIGLLFLDRIARDQLGSNFPEPYSFTSGISSWPRLMWLHIACSFSFFLLLGMIVRQRESVASEIALHQHWNTTDPNDTASLSRPREGQRDSLQLLEQWVDKTRGYQVFLLSGICALVYTLAFANLAPTFEYHQFFRNKDLAWLSSSLQIASNFLFAWMCFYYLITLFRYLHRMQEFFSASASFPRRVLKTARREHGYRHASDTAVDQLLDIEIAARSSHVVGNQLLHPFLSLAAVVLGLSSYFDAANFSTSWIVFHALLVGSLILGATYLRHVLEEVRSTALATCHRMIAQTDSSDAAKADTEILNHIAGIQEGAFAPWHHRPVMKALLYPLGSGGLALLSSGIGG